VLALYLRGECFDDEAKARDFSYYERITVRDSSLSAAVQSVVAAEMGHLDLAYDYLSEAAMVDLANLQENTTDGLHIASLAGGWMALVAGFGGMRARGGRLSFAPRLPDGIGRLAFNLLYRGRRIGVTITPEGAEYRLRSGEPFEITHHGEKLVVGDQAVRRDIPPATPGRRPTQPRGREPSPRRLGRR
jgi:alpha,alpha-trehalose phosphorylase